MASVADFSDLFKRSRKRSPVAERRSRGKSLGGVVQLLHCLLKCLGLFPNRRQGFAVVIDAPGRKQGFGSVAIFVKRMGVPSRGRNRLNARLDLHHVPSPPDLAEATPARHRIGSAIFFQTARRPG